MRAVDKRGAICDAVIDHAERITGDTITRRVNKISTMIIAVIYYCNEFQRANDPSLSIIRAGYARVTLRSIRADGTRLQCQN